MLEETGSEASLYEWASRSYYQMRRMRHRMFSDEEQKLLHQLFHSRQTWWPSPLLGNSEVYAFALWQAAWERSSVFGLPLAFLPHRDPPLTVVQWLASRPLANPDEPVSSVLRRFDGELSRSYLRCEWLISWMRNKGGVLMSPEVLRLLIPQFCVRLPR